MTVSASRRDSPDGHFILTFEPAQDKRIILEAFLEGRSVNQIAYLTDLTYNNEAVIEIIRDDLKEKTEALNRIQARVLEEGFDDNTQ